MQAGVNHDVMPCSSESDRGDSGTPFQLSAKLMERINELEDWHINASRIEFPENPCRFEGGHATILRAILNLGSDEGRGIDDGSDVDKSENAGDPHESHGHASREKTVAVKMVKIESPDDRERALKSALREVRFLAELQHDNIVKLEGFVEDLPNDRVWLIFPWEENGNLKDFAASRDWEIPERIWLINDVTLGVEHLHNRDPPICHGDLKSVNILVTSKCRAVITDFGSARQLREKDLDTRATSTQAENTAKPSVEFQATFCASTNTMTLTGNQYTLRWAAPELLMDAEPGLWSDIWALGWIFYEVMTNTIPFQNVRNDSMVIKQVIQGVLPSVTDHDRMSLIIQLCSLMIKCWSVDPSERPTAESCQKSMRWMPMVAPDPQPTSESGALKGRSPRLLMELGSMHLDQDDYMNASRFFTEALDLYTHMGDSAGRASALYSLAKMHYFRDEGDEALKFYSESLDIYTNIGDRRERARALRGLARVHLDQEEYSTAITFFSEAAQICDDIGDKHGRAYSLDGLAHVYLFQSHYTEAVTLYSEVLEIHDEMGDRGGRADALCHLGDVRRCQHEYHEAATLLSEAFRIYTDTGDRSGAATSLLCLADVHRDQDQHNNAISLYEQAAEKFDEMGNAGRVAIALECAAEARRKIEAEQTE